MEANRCTATRADGQPCHAQPMPGADRCFAHDPAVRAKRREGQRKGGEARSNARRAAKLWASIGGEIADEDLPSLLKSLIFAVRSGEVEPGVATCIANLAKTAVAITSDIDLEKRIAALEAAAADTQPTPQPLRRFGA